MSGTAVYDLAATQATVAVAGFGGADHYSTLSQPLPANATTVILAPLDIFGGPAWISFLVKTAPTWVFTLTALDGFDVENTIEERDSTVDGTGRQRFHLYVPAWPLLLQVQNTSVTAGTVDMSLEYDLHRVG